MDSSDVDEGDKFIGYAEISFQTNVISNSKCFIKNTSIA
jgi:hypothetical protein